MKKELINKLRSLIANDKVSDSIELMRQHEDIFDTYVVSNLSSQWLRVVTAYRVDGVLSVSDATTLQNKIIFAILDFLKQTERPIDNNDSLSKESSDKVRGKILLTSMSPRRIEILQGIGWTKGGEFFVHPVNSNPDKDYKNNQLTLNEAKSFAISNAKAKAQILSSEHFEEDPFNKFGLNINETIVIGIDTIVFCNGYIIDRPLLKSLAAASELDITDAKQTAREMLLNQRGKEITVLTGMYAFRGRNMSSKIEECVETTVFMREYTDKEIDEYIETFEPIDKAGAFGIQGKGISLMEAIRGDYYNVVGLPLVALKRILEHNNFKDLYFDFYTSTTLRVQEHSLPVKPHEFAVLSIGDINYDFVYNNLPDNFIDIINIDNSIKIQGPIDRKAGGTAVQFAKGAKKAGFKNIYIAGVYGNDVLGQEIEKELRREKFEPLLGAKYKQEKTSIAIIIRQTGQKDFSITITDSIQSLPPASREELVPYIGKSDVIYCSGYCITDNNRRYSTEQILSLSRNSKKIVILDVVKNMDTKIKFNELKDQILRVKNVLYGFTENAIDIVVSEFREIFRWLGVDEDQKDEINIFEKNREFIINELKPFFSLVILRTSDYSKEVIIQLNSDTKIRTNNLDYPKTSNERLGYSDMLTAKYIHSFLSPRVLLASKSPQRITLLKQIMADTKIIVHPSNVDEGEVINDEDIVRRVTRLAMKKAEQSLINNTIPTIEFVIGADTEIGLRDNNGGWDVIPHPKTDEEAYKCIKKLSGTTHSAVTGIAIIYRDEKSKEIKKIVDSMETRVEFFELDDDTIKTYISSKEPINRAGGYAIQGKGAMLVKRIEGSYSNVVGLPLELLISMLKKYTGKGILDFNEVSNWSFPNTIS